MDTVAAVLDVRKSGRVFVWTKAQRGQNATYSLYVASICGTKISFKRCLRFSDLGHPSLNEDARVRFSELDVLEEPLPEIRPAELAEILLSTALREDKALPYGRHACSLISPRFCGVISKAFIAFDFVS